MARHVHRMRPGLVPPLAGATSLVERLRRGISEAQLECACVDAANGVLDRIKSEDDLVRRAAGLADARRMRDAIVLVISLLGELDELMPEEADMSAFLELADLFEDVSGFAAFGAQSARSAVGERR